MKNERDLDSDEEDYSENTDDILALLQGFSENEDSQNDKTIEEEEFYNKDIEQDESSKMDDTDEDLMQLLSMISGKDDDQSIDNDILAINDLLDEEESIDLEDQRNQSSNVGNIFSDVLGAVNSLEDEENKNILDMIPDISDKKIEEIKSIQGTKKLGFWKKIFSKSNIEKKEKNVLPNKIKKNKIKLNKDENKEVINKEDINNKEVIKKKEKQNKIKKEKKNIKSSKKNKNEKNNDIEENGTNKNQKVISKKLKPKANKKKAKVNLKLDKKLDAESVIDSIKIDDFEEDTGKINKTAASFVLVFFVLIAALVILGSNAYSYSLGIRTATNNFDMKRYNQAYNEVYGLDIKDRDIEIYDKIMTVMFVNKQLNSYNNNYSLGQYPEALDSLLKGLTRYDKYIKFATKLGIKSDLKYVRKQIIGELKSKFDMKEDEAMSIINSEDQVQYSNNVFEAVLGK